MKLKTSPIFNCSSFFVLSCILLIILQCQNEISAERILVISFLNSKSVKHFYEPLYLELASRGHNLTIISPFKSSKPHPNIRDIVGPDLFSLQINKKNQQEDDSENETKIEKDPFNPIEDRLNGVVKSPFSWTDNLVELCRQYYSLPEIQELIQNSKSPSSFDLIIGTYTYNECILGLIHHLRTKKDANLNPKNVPFILLHANVPLPWNNPTGMPYPLSHVPLPYFGSTHFMNFRERVVNFLFATIYGALDNYWRIPRLERVYKDFLGEETPSVEKITKNVSLIMSNSFYGLNFPRPTMPDLIEIGGMHCQKQPAELPKDIKEFLDGAGDEGFILFSLGSIVKSSTMPEEIRKIFLRVFSQLKQRVIWKWETEDMPDLPKNVMLKSWLPQQSILARNDCRLFISHGGLHSIEESIFHQTPVLGFPFYGDQDANMMLAEFHGFALTLQITDLDEKKLLDTINTMLIEKKYKENALRMSAIFRDRLDEPLASAVFWTEYIIHHRGAPHLRSPARDLNFFAYYSLDTLLFLLSIIILVFYITLLIIKYIIIRILKKLLRNINDLYVSFSSNTNFASGIQNNNNNKPRRSKSEAARRMRLKLH